VLGFRSAACTRTAFTLVRSPDRLGRFRRRPTPAADSLLSGGRNAGCADGPTIHALAHITGGGIPGKPWLACFAGRWGHDREPTPAARRGFTTGSAKRESAKRSSDVSSTSESATAARHSRSRRRSRDLVIGGWRRASKGCSSLDRLLVSGSGSNLQALNRRPGGRCRSGLCRLEQAGVWDWSEPRRRESRPGCSSSPTTRIAPPATRRWPGWLLDSGRPMGRAGGYMHVLTPAF